MSTIISVIIIILSMLITGLLQLTPGLFSIFYHYVSAKRSFKKADDLSLHFILGTELFVTIIFAIIYILTFAIFQKTPDFPTPIFFWIMFGIFIAEAIAFLLFYFKKGTALFVSRKYVKTLTTYAQKSTTRTDAFVLGFFSNIAELIFTLPLYIISIVILLNNLVLPRQLLIIIYISTIIIPLFIIRAAYHTGHNLADITRFRAHLKPFLRIFIPILYVFLAIAILNLGVI